MYTDCTVRAAIEMAILKFKPDISAKELVDAREEIMSNIISVTSSIMPNMQIGYTPYIPSYDNTPIVGKKKII